MPLYKPTFDIPKLRQKRDNQMRRDNRRGSTYADISRKYNVSRWTAARVCKREG